MTTTLPRQLPADRSTSNLHVKMSETIMIKCVCGYEGFARMITGRSEYPIYSCPSCRRIAQVIRAKGKE